MFMPGLNVIAFAELDVLAALSVEEVAFEPTGTEMIGGGSEATVSAGVGGCFVEELQPGFAKITINASRWTPATMPENLRIFMGGMVRSWKLKAISNCRGG